VTPIRPNRNLFQSFNEINAVNKIQSNQRTVKIPAEIVHSKLDFNLSKKIKMSDRVNKIFGINWSMQPVDYQISLTANRLWLSSKIRGEITYTKGVDTQVRVQTFYLPWKSSTDFQYIFPPVLPRSDQKKQYEFFDDQNTVETTNYEQMIHNNESPMLDIISTRVITSQSISKNSKCIHLLLDLECEIEYRILQSQLIQF
jgi:hypothetical protein